jgi:serine/threonine protein kinase
VLARYRSFEKLGAGGMGVVYRAEDSDLRRPIALKFVTEAAHGQKAQRARFLREARLAGSLNHPNVCTIHEVGEVEPGEEHCLGGGVELPVGIPFIAMEFIEGRSLESALRLSGPLEVDALLRIAVQVAEALAAAHTHGIVHRDLKPGNVMLTTDDRVKILDFGLAKPFAPTKEDDDVMAAAETVSAELTRAGLVIGTVAYMSPEQARGAAVDSRSDVFSFGIILYEMATGRRPFRGDTPTSTLAKILEAEAEPVDDARPDLPSDLSRIIRRCLSKRPDDRYNDTRDLVAALRDLQHVTTSQKVRKLDTEPSVPPRDLSGTVTAVPRSRVRRWAVAASAVALVALVAAFYHFGVRPPGLGSPSPTHRQITFTGEASSPAISPDGQSVSYVTTGADGTQVLLVRDLSGGQPLEIFRAEFTYGAAWSPDGSRLLLSAKVDGRQGTFIVPRLGGPASVLTVRALNMPSWSPDGRRYRRARIDPACRVLRLARLPRLVADGGALRLRDPRRAGQRRDLDDAGRRHRTADRRGIGSRTRTRALGPHGRRHLLLRRRGPDPEPDEGPGPSAHGGPTG